MIEPSFPTIRLALPLLDIGFEGVRITKSLLKFDEGEEVGVPISERVWRLPYSNCGKKVKGQVHKTYDFERTTGFRITTDLTITDHFEISGDFQFSEGTGVKGMFSRNVEFKQSNEYTLTNSVKDSTIFYFEVDPDINVEISIITRQMEYRRSFEGPVTVDGTVVARYGFGPGLYGIKYYALSELFPSEEDRSFIITGQYGNIDAVLQPVKVEYFDC